MSTLALQAVVICVLLQVPGVFPSCLITGPIASCAHQNLRWVPALPPNITHLYLEMNRIGEINATSLSGLEKLQHLDLGHQFKPLVIRDNAFKNQRHLTRLTLGSNVGLQLEPQAFVGLSALKNLDLNYCSLQDSILKDNYMEPLTSLETLNLFGNKINRIQPSMFFKNMTHLKDLNLKLNKIDKICEPDLAGFEGKRFSFLHLDSVFLTKMNARSFDWEKCGNPFRGMSIETLSFSSNGLGLHQLKQFFKAIKGTKISHLKLSGHVGRGFSFNNLPDPDRSTFEGLRNSSLNILDLSKNRVFALQQGVFSPLKDVKVIDISQNRVNQIRRRAFEGLQGHLIMLNLSYNLLGEIYSDTFSSLTSLKILDLSHNHIGALGFNSFSGLPNLKALFLTGNSIRQLGFLASLPNLDNLMLNNNRLASLYGITQLANNTTHLDISYNRLTDLAGVDTILSTMKNLQYLFYGGNTIRWCTPYRRASVTDLKILDLHSSSLQSIWSKGKCLDLFDNLSNVIKLNLTFNSLQTLPTGIFKGLTSVLVIDLSSNALTYLQPDDFPKSLQFLSLANNFIASPPPSAFHSLLFLDLKMNRFHCGPDLNGFLTWMKETNVTFVSPVEELRCEFPSSFQGVKLLDYSAQVTQQ
ncbi:toll-like receptor 5 [Sphaeramia orbicularis]|uniref:Toll-like receptor 5 n=1 Tax=Sphaeramia orbicularis TaxID=375764 RepID=A0A673AE95_9TELE|nr:toll-like receptor 5 [Sphaeramia orbicularis]